MATNKEKFSVSVADGRYNELDKNTDLGFNVSQLLFEVIEKIEDLEARVSALETP